MDKMDKIVTVLDGVDYAQYYITGIMGGDPPVPDLSSNGVADPTPEGVVVRTGTHMGRIKIQVDLCDWEPSPNLEKWDEAVETSFRSDGHIFITSLDGYVDTDHIALTPGPQRVRVCVRGRERGRELNTVMEGEEIPEEHLIQIWPAPLTSDKVLKTGDEIGVILRR